MAPTNRIRDRVAITLGLRSIRRDETLPEALSVIVRTPSIARRTWRGSLSSDLNRPPSARVDISVTVDPARCQL